ncbi:ABC transporter substrate-binding protein [Streptomyces canus]|uniref:ABC transporter substrate-binding protein n=1 Tax=Streptomyces canus TaxID=58343 RepID=UPI000527DCF9|nr:ABC transporter substrate-binding protein [Streptomyces canus]
MSGLLAAGCSGGHKEAAEKGAGGAVSGSYPVSVTDCAGAKTTFDGPPRKIVTSNAAGLELLLRLGVGDRVVGTGFPSGSGTLPDGLDAEARKVKVLSKGVIPKERLLGSGADLYLDTFGAMKMNGAGEAATVDEYSAAGIKHIYLKSTACAATGEGAVTDLSAVEADIASLGAVTGAGAKAEELVAGMKRKVAAVQKAIGSTPPSARPTYFFFDYDAGTQQPVVVCNRQVANAVITLAGARNVFDCDGTTQRVGWEDVISRNPDWIQLGVRNKGSREANDKAFAEAERWLRSNAATKGLKAVEEGHFLRIGSERTTIAGVENADTVETIARSLYPNKVR